MHQLTFAEIRKSQTIQNLTSRQRTILSFLEQQVPKAIIAKRLNLSNARISQIVKELESEGIIKRIATHPAKQATRNYTHFYELAPDAKAQLTGEKTLPLTTFHVHHIGMKYRILRQSGDISTDKRITGDPVKSWRTKPKSPQFHAFWFSGKSGHPHVTLYIYPKKIVAWVNKGQIIPAASIQDAERIGDLAIQTALDQFIDKQRQFRVHLETDSGAIMGKRHYGGMIREDHPNMQKALAEGLNCKGWHADKSPDDKIPGMGEVETYDIERATGLENVINMAPELVKLPDLIRDTINPLNTEVSQVKAMIQGGITMQQQYEQMVNLLTKTLTEMSEMRKELMELRRKVQGTE